MKWIALLLMCACDEGGFETRGVQLVTITTQVRIDATALNDGLLKDQLRDRCGYRTDAGLAFGAAQTMPTVYENCGVVPQEVWHFNVTATLPDAGTFTLPPLEVIDVQPDDFVRLGDLLQCDADAYQVGRDTSVTGAVTSDYLLPGLIGEGRIVETHSAAIGEMDVTVFRQSCDGNWLGAMP
jgi:hypothetical protein